MFPFVLSEVSVFRVKNKSKTLVYNEDECFLEA